MDKFLLATNPLRAEKKFLFIVHAVHPLALIRCEFEETDAELFPGQIRGTVQVQDPSYGSSHFETWILTAITYDTATDSAQLLKRAWRWFYAYRQQFPLNYTIHHANDGKTA